MCRVTVDDGGWAGGDSVGMKGGRGGRVREA